MSRRVRKVIDSNYLSREELRQYLAETPQHYAVITSAALTEIVKGNPLRSIVSSMAVLSEFPRQVIILKGDAAVARLTESVSNPQLRLIDKHQTSEFPGFCEKLAAMKPLAVNEFLSQGRIVNEGFKQAHSAIEESADMIPKAVEHYTAAERKMLNAGGALPRTLIRQVFDAVLVMTELKLKHIKAGEVPTGIRLLDAFAFREALCTYIWLLSSLRGKPPTNPRKITNSIMDVSFATFATYFDDLLSTDHLALHIHGVASTWLRQLRGDGIPVL